MSPPWTSSPPRTALIFFVAALAVEATQAQSQIDTLALVNDPAWVADFNARLDAYEADSSSFSEREHARLKADARIYVEAADKGYITTSDVRLSRQEGVPYDSAGAQYVVRNGEVLKHYSSTLDLGPLSEQKGAVSTSPLAPLGGVVVIVFFVWVAWLVMREYEGNEEETDRTRFEGSQEGVAPEPVMENPREHYTRSPSEPSATEDTHDDSFTEDEVDERNPPDEEERIRRLRAAGNWALLFGIVTVASSLIVLLDPSTLAYGDGLHMLDLLLAMPVGAAMIYWGLAIKRASPKSRKYLAYLIAACSFFALSALLTERTINFALNVSAVAAFVYARRTLPEEPEPTVLGEDEPTAVPSEPAEAPRKKKYSLTLGVENGPHPEPPPVAPTLASAPPPSPTDPLSTLRELARLKDEGVITEEEFETKKGELLARI